MFCSQCGSDLTGMSGSFCNMCGAQVGIAQPTRAAHSPASQQRAVSPRNSAQNSNYTRTSRRQNRAAQGKRTMAIGAIAAVGVIVLVVVLLSRTSGNNGETPVDFFRFRADAETQGVRIDEYIGTDINVRIPARIEGEPVTSIGREAFSQSGIMSVHIPNTVVVIENSAFRDSRGLTSVTIGNSVERIGSSAFSGTGLTEVVIPNSVEYIGSSAFASTNLTRVTIGSSVEHIGDSAFSGTELTEIVIPNSVKYIGSSAFARTNLTSVTMGNSVEFIGPRAFAGTELTSIDIPNSLVTITCGVFPNIRDLEEIVIPYGVTKIGSFDSLYLRGVISGVVQGEVLDLPEVVRLRSVVIPNSVTEIDDRAFLGTDITHVLIPDSVTTIGEGAFANCNYLTCVTIGNRMTYISEFAFTGSTALTVESRQAILNINPTARLDGWWFGEEWD